MKRIREIISGWYSVNKRKLPWRVYKEPYVIWLSEVILQQTRIEQGIPYFMKFVKKYPTLPALSKAQEDDVLKLWQGLGYYSRARNMLNTAKTIVNQYKGVFPDNYKDLMKLKGIGDYTASIILSICYNKPYAVVDGNVFRVTARLFGINEYIDTTTGKKIFKDYADRLLDKKYPGDFNQAMMDFGALVCTPQNPKCEVCPLQKDCAAFKKGLQNTLPKRTPKKNLTKRFFHYLFIKSGNKILLRKRTDNDIWKNLYDFPLIETNRSIVLRRKAIEEYLTTTVDDCKPVEKMNHILSHQEITIQFYEVTTDVRDKRFVSVTATNLKKYAVPKPVEKFLKNQTSNCLPSSAKKVL